MQKNNNNNNMKSPKVQNNNLDSSWNESDFVPDVVATNDDDNVDDFSGNINRRSIQPYHPSMMMGGRRRRRTSSSQQQYRLLPSITHASRTALLEIPLRYDNGTLVQTQTNRMAISSVQPLLLPPLAYYFFGQQQEQQPQRNWLLRLHAATAMRGKTGFSTVQTGVQYNFATTTTMATPTTFTAGVILGEQAPVVYLGGGGRSCLVMSSSFQRHNVSAQVKIPTTQPQKTQVSWNSRHAILINRNAPYSNRSSSNHTLDLLTSCCISPMNFFISSRNISKINNNTAMLQINLVSHQTQHAWNVGLGWNLFQARRSNSNSSSSLSRSNSSRSSYYPTLSFQFAPRLSLWHRHVSFRVSTNGRWDGDGTITTTTTISTATAKQQQSSTSTHTTTTPNNKQPTKPVTKFSVSVHRILQPSSGGLLVWTFSLTQGDFTLRIPVTIATTTTAAAAAAAAATAVKDTAAVAWWYTNPSWQFVYISMLSHILHDMLADILQLNVSNNTASTTAATTAQQQQQKEQWLLARDKARHEAILQQQFMAKQAKIRTDAEREIEGLVITRAVYAYYNKNPDDKIAESSSLSSSSSSIISSLDVTIPLQFWVTDSSLHLPPALSKANMLGFYNVAASVPTSAAATTTTKESSTLPESSSSPRSSSWSSSTFLWNNPFVKWLSGLWTFRSSTTTAINHEDSVHRRNVQLTVQYDYAGRSYEITVSDQDELYLPNPLARLVGRHPEPVAE